MIQHMCLACGVCGCEGNPCKPVRTRKPTTPTKRVTHSAIDKELAQYPPNIQAQIRAKLGQ